MSKEKELTEEEILEQLKQEEEYYKSLANNEINKDCVLF